jgi:hypothetical protein
VASAAAPHPVLVEERRQAPPSTKQKPLIGADILLDNDRIVHNKGVERCRSRFRNP